MHTSLLEQLVKGHVERFFRTVFLNETYEQSGRNHTIFSGEADTENVESTFLPIEVFNAIANLIMIYIDKLIVGQMGKLLVECPSNDHPPNF